MFGPEAPIIQANGMIAKKLQKKIYAGCSCMAFATKPSGTQLTSISERMGLLRAMFTKPPVMDGWAGGRAGGWMDEWMVQT